MDSPPATILIVDDHTATRDLLTQVLGAAFPACRLLQTGTGESAVEYCRTHRPQIIVMDIEMPGMDGIEAARRIREQFEDLRVVIHSSHNEQPYRDNAAAAGVLAFVVKSGDCRELVTTVSRLLSAAR